ncbi:hypothetical protein COX97_03135 [Candidatus Pacearchaeota archaeon CG_4_10_14_0_2_um_filter_05_32_18]|nr:MAG: hypothetical protein COX97_03135 [Candidatus Pacearchaeota archaeon CG_4_10_14_0_2_um_filter_05_32_18]
MNKELNNAVKRFILVGTENNGYRHRYGVVKNESFKQAFIGFMGDLGFDKKTIQNGFIIQENERTIILMISDLIDVCKHYQNIKYDIDVFYGKDKIIILVRVIDRDKLIEEITKHKWKDFSKENIDKLFDTDQEKQIIKNRPNKNESS